MPKTVQLQDCPSVTDANWNFWLDHFKRLLLEKRQELLDSTGEAGIRVPAAGGHGEILSKKPMPVPKPSFKSGCIRLTVHFCERLKIR